MTVFMNSVIFAGMAESWEFSEQDESKEEIAAMWNERKCKQGSLTRTGGPLICGVHF